MPEHRALPLFSVIVPVYNRPKLVAEALDSVLSQSFTDFEVIAVDDGSTDETPRILTGYAGRVRVLRQPNGGAGAARNLALRHAHGEYAVFLDSDDLWPPWTLQVYAEILGGDDIPSLIVCVPVRRGLDDEAEKVARTALRAPVLGDFLEIARNMHDFRSGVLPVARVQALLDAGGFPEPAMAFEDWDLLLRLGLEPIFSSVESPPLLIYRHHAASESHDPRLLHRGVTHCLAQEAAGHYPGGHARCRERRAILCSLLRFAIMRCLLGGELQLGYSLYRRGLSLFIRERRWRLMAALPLVPLIHPLLPSGSLDPYFQR